MAIEQNLTNKQYSLIHSLFHQQTTCRYKVTLSNSLHIDDKLWVDVREPTEDILVKVHQEQLVSRRWPENFCRELPVKVADVSRTFLKNTFDITTHIHARTCAHTDNILSFCLTGLFFMNTMDQVRSWSFTGQMPFLSPNQQRQNTEGVHPILTLFYRPFFQVDQC